MKTLPLYTVVMLLPILAYADTNIVTMLKHDASQCTALMLSNDYPSILKYTHPKAIAAMGGRDRMISALKAAQSQISSSGMKVTNIQIGTPSKPKKVGNSTVSLLPQVTLIDAPKASIKIESTLLCVSSDNGQHWVFMDVGALSTTQFNQLFPELKQHILLPEKKQPVFTRK